MPIILLIDTEKSRLSLYPLSLTRPVCDIRVGIFTMREWWNSFLATPVFALTEPYLQESFPDSPDYYLCVDATVTPDKSCQEKILALKAGEMLEDEQGLVAYGTNTRPAFNQIPVWPDHSFQVSPQLRINHVTDIFKKNETYIRLHFDAITEGRPSNKIDDSNFIFNSLQVFVEDDAKVMASTVNAKEGPVYIGRNALVMEGVKIRGPVAIGEGAVVKMGAKLYPGTTIGPYCTVGGEIKNSIFLGYSNKAHDGYLGDSVIGAWCNFGAGTSNSNVKNTGGPVKMWQQATRSFIEIGQKGGLIMGDFSRCAINSSFNTGTTIGVSCNIFDGTYPEKHLPSFSWGNHERYEFEKACLDAANWKKMKGKEFTQADRLILQHIYQPGD